jgi:hypothetical protein
MGEIPLRANTWRVSVARPQPERINPWVYLPPKAISLIATHCVGGISFASDAIIPPPKVSLALTEVSFLTAVLPRSESALPGRLPCGLPGIALGSAKD